MRQAPLLLSLVQQRGLCSRGHRDCRLHPPGTALSPSAAGRQAGRREKQGQQGLPSKLNSDKESPGMGEGAHSSPSSQKAGAPFACHFCGVCPVCPSAGSPDRLELPWHPLPWALGRGAGGHAASAVVSSIPASVGFAYRVSLAVTAHTVQTMAKTEAIIPETRAHTKNTHEHRRLKTRVFSCLYSGEEESSSSSSSSSSLKEQGVSPRDSEQ